MASVITTYLEEAYVKLQSAFDTFETIAATDAVSPGTVKATEVSEEIHLEVGDEVLYEASRVNGPFPRWRGNIDRGATGVWIHGVVRRVDNGIVDIKPDDNFYTYAFYLPTHPDYPEGVPLHDYLRRVDSAAASSESESRVHVATADSGDCPDVPANLPTVTLEYPKDAVACKEDAQQQREITESAFRRQAFLGPWPFCSACGCNRSLRFRHKVADTGTHVRDTVTGYWTCKEKL